MVEEPVASSTIVHKYHDRQGQAGGGGGGREGGREGGGREGEREGGREGGREEWRKGEREGGREREREGGREGGREGREGDAYIAKPHPPTAMTTINATPTNSSGHTHSPSECIQ